MSLELTNKVGLLKDRAAMLAKARFFFAARSIVEVDVPALYLAAPIDPYIDIVTASCMQKRCYLHSSPEYGMKRLLAIGMPDCFQLSHVFRDLELGERHQPEFTMVEWYRLQHSFEQLIEETLDFCQLFIGCQDVQVYSYEQLFWDYIGYFPDTIEQRDRCFADSIEPNLQALTVVKDYPAEQAMLAKTYQLQDLLVANRFELFFKGIELANGYEELNDVQELRKRLIANNQKRKELNKEVYPLDEAFLNAKIPDCCGVAVGFDRLMALRHRAENLTEILPLAWDSSR